MSQTQDIVFHSYTHGTLTFDQMISAIGAFVRLSPEKEYKISIGTDSPASKRVPLITAITVRRMGNGASYFWTSSEERTYPTLRDRIYQEAITSITLAQEVRSRLKEELGDDFFWDSNEVHVDVGHNGPTRELIDGVTGMIRGYGFIPITKPASYTASVVADRHT